jgi:hypothetical protein
MLWLYLIAAALIAWGIAKDISRQETWLIGFGKVVRKEQPGKYWLTIMLRVLICFAVIIAAYLRSRVS